MEEQEAEHVVPTGEQVLAWLHERANQPLIETLDPADVPF